MKHIPTADNPRKAVCGALIRVRTGKKHQITSNCRTKGDCPSCKRRDRGIGR